METDARKLIYDLEQATTLIAAFTQAKTFSDYQSDALLRSGVERQFEIVGEALNRLRKAAPDVVVQISNYHRIIGFRNILAHGYDVIAYEIVWDIVQNRLADLRNEIAKIQRDLDVQ